MTPKETMLMDYTLEAIGSIHEAIAQADVRPLANALRKLTAMQVLLEANTKTETLSRPVTGIKETPEQPPLDIADQVPLEPVKETKAEPKPEPKPEPAKEKKKNTGHRLTKEEKEKILYMRAQKIAAVCIAEKIGCSPQTVLNIEKEHKQKQAKKIEVAARFGSGAGGGRNIKWN